MKIKLLFTAVLIIGICQSNVKILSNSISKLNWNSFKINIISVRVLTSINNDAQKIINIKMSRKRKSKILIDSLKNDNAVVIHMILTKMYNPEKFILTYTTNYHKKANGQVDYDDLENDTVSYCLNGVKWDEYYDHNVLKYAIKRSQISLMEKHWREILKIYNKN